MERVDEMIHNNSCQSTIINDLQKILTTEHRLRGSMYRQPNNRFDENLGTTSSKKENTVEHLLCRSISQPNNTLDTNLATTSHNKHNSGEAKHSIQVNSRKSFHTHDNEEDLLEHDDISEINFFMASSKKRMHDEYLCRRAKRMLHSEGPMYLSYRTSFRIQHMSSPTLSYSPLVACKLSFKDCYENNVNSLNGSARCMNGEHTKAFVG